MKYGLLVLTALALTTVGSIIWIALQKSGSHTEASKVVIGQAEPVPEMPKPVPSKVTARSTDGMVAKEDIKPIAEQPAVPAPRAVSISEALESMRNSLKKGDRRTPPLAEEGLNEAQPTPEELSDPDLYQQFEARQSARIASIYLSAIKEIPLIRQKIQQAKMTGSQTQEEIEEAEEALAKLESLKQEFETTYPEMIDLMEEQASEATQP